MNNEANNKSIEQQILQAAQTLKAGKLVAFPTDTVYGLGADANNPEAVAKVFAAKGRPTTHPLIVHIPNAKHLDQWAKSIPQNARILSEHFWPGPLTMILPKQDQVPDSITGGLATVALRVPRHPLTLEMLRQFDGGIVGPSANTHGLLTPTTAAHVQEDLGNKVDYILDGGACEIGIESTIVYFKGEMPYIVRQGSITANDISRVLGIKVTTDAKVSAEIRAPGSMQRHYAPKKPLLLVKSNLQKFMQELINNPDKRDEITNLVKQQKLKLSKDGKNIAVLSFLPKPADFQGHSWQQMPDNVEQYAKHLYACLHNADQPEVDLILVEFPPNTEAWAAIIDRLTRSSELPLILTP